MAIETKVTVDARFFLKWVSVEKLKAIFNDLQDKDLLYNNQTGNLLVVRDGKPLGYINLSSETFETF